MMDLKKIMAIAGYPGLFKLVSQGKNNIIVESLIDKKRMPAFSTHKVSSLEDIAVFTETKEVPLKDVLKSIFEKETGKETLDPKSDPEKLKEYFSTVLPDYNREKVYASDIKKMLTWYNLLLKNELLDFTEEEKPVEEPVQEVKAETKPEATKVPAEENKPEKKEKAAPKAKKAPAKKAEKAEGGSEEKAPAKPRKTSPKKKEE